jgi:hypothetical protein
VTWSSRSVPPCTEGLGVPAHTASVPSACANATVRRPVASGTTVVGLEVIVYVPGLSKGTVPSGFSFATSRVTLCPFS